MADRSKTLPLTRESVKSAHSLIEPYIHRTAVLTSTTLSNLSSTPQTPESLVGTPFEGQEPARPKINLFFKCENYQRIGAFKSRGAFHALSRLGDKEVQKGVVTHSSGMEHIPKLSTPSDYLTFTSCALCLQVTMLKPSPSPPALVVYPLTLSCRPSPHPPRSPRRKATVQKSSLAAAHRKKGRPWWRM